MLENVLNEADDKHRIVSVYRMTHVTRRQVKPVRRPEGQSSQVVRTQPNRVAKTLQSTGRSRQHCNDGYPLWQAQRPRLRVIVNHFGTRSTRTRRVLPVVYQGGWAGVSAAPAPPLAPREEGTELVPHEWVLD